MKDSVLSKGMGDFYQMFVRLHPDERKAVSNCIFSALAKKIGRKEAWRFMQHELGINQKWLPFLGEHEQYSTGTSVQKRRVHSYNVVVSVNLV